MENIIINLQNRIRNKQLIKKFDNETDYNYCMDYEDLEEVIGRDNIIIFDDRRDLYEFEYWNDEEKNKYSYNYLHINKMGEIKIKDVLRCMIHDSFYNNNNNLYNNHIFLEGFDKTTDIQYNIGCGS